MVTPSFRSVVLTLAVTACGGGDPGGLDAADTVLEGGTLAVPGCTYSITSRLGAEAPQLSVDTFGADATPKNIHLGIVGDPQTSMVAQWRTTDDTTLAGTVHYAEGAGLPAASLARSAVGIEYVYKSTGDERVRVHQAHMCDLLPGTAYSYQVGARDPQTGTEHFSDVFTFRTAPDIVAHPDAEVVIASLGDCRNGYDTWEQLTTLAKTHDPDLVLFSGDAVTVGITQFEWEPFFARAQPLLATTPMVFANGNHEANAVNYYAQIALPGDQEDYAIDWGYMHLTVLNDTPDDLAEITGKAHDFLAADLATHATARWKLSMHHQSVFSSATGHGSNVQLQQVWQPLYDQYGVDLVLNGHDHDFEMSKPMVAQVPQASVDTGTVYVVQGGAGAELYDNAPQFFSSYAEKTYSASILHVRKTQLTLDAFRPDGSAIPSAFTKTKP